MKKSKKIILTLSAVTLTAGVLFTGIGYMNGGRFGFVFSDGKFISADRIEGEKQPFINPIPYPMITSPHTRNK